MLSNEEKLSLLKSITIFSGINEEKLSEIYSHCKVVLKKAGDIIVEEGTEASQIYIILSGRIRIVLNMKKSPIILAELGPRECVGEASIIGIQRHCASAVIVEDAEVLVFPRKVLMDIYTEDKELFSLLILNIARELARRLYQADKTIICYQETHSNPHPAS
jgi:CRP-like cAMP-binding protein